MTGKPAEIIPLFEDCHIPGPVEEVVEALREALEMAERGEVAAVALVLITPGGFQRTRGVPGSQGFGRLCGGAAALQSDLINCWKTE